MNSLNHQVSNLKNKGLLLLVLGFSICASCVSGKRVNGKSEVESAPKIIFLNYIISKDKDGEKHMRFINHVIANGKLKKRPNVTNEAGQHDLICLQQDKKSNIVDRIVIKNPLSRTLEFIDDSKKFVTKVINLDSTEMALRLQLNNRTKYITFIDSITQKRIIRTKIDQK